MRASNLHNSRFPGIKGRSHTTHARPGLVSSIDGLWLDYFGSFASSTDRFFASVHPFLINRWGSIKKITMRGITVKWCPFRRTWIICCCANCFIWWFSAIGIRYLTSIRIFHLSAIGWLIPSTYICYLIPFIFSMRAFLLQESSWLLIMRRPERSSIFDH